MSERFEINKMDCEERFGIASAGMFAAGKFSSLLWGVLLSALVYGVLILLELVWGENLFIRMFFPGGAEKRTIIPAITVLASMWCLAMLLIKKSKLKLQKKALKALAEMDQSANSAAVIQERFFPLAAFAAPALLLKRLELQADNTPPTEVIAVIDDTLNDLEKASDNSFIPASCLIWAVPVLGFIGTVLGLARAVSNFGELLTADLAGSFAEALPQVTGGLATAFETTFIALILALLLQLLSSSQSHAEANFFAELKTVTAQIARSLPGTDMQ